MEVSFNRGGQHLLQLLLSPQELTQSKAIDVEFLALRFAAKEAVAKALKTGLTRDFRATEITILPQPSGGLTCCFSKQAHQIVSDLGVQIYISSLAFDDTVLAYAAAVRSRILSG